MTVIKLKSGNNDDDDRTQISEESVFEVTVLDVAERETQWYATDRDTQKQLLNADGNPYKNREFNFKFKIIDPDGPYNNRFVWGTTGLLLGTWPTCKLSNWIRAILDEPVLPEGFAIDLDGSENDDKVGGLDGLRCRVVVKAKKRDNGSFSNWVSDVYPAKADQTVQERVQEHLAPNENAGYDPNEEPFG